MLCGAPPLNLPWPTQRMTVGAAPGQATSAEAARAAGEPTIFRVYQLADTHYCPTTHCKAKKKGLNPLSLLKCVCE